MAGGIGLGTVTDLAPLALPTHDAAGWITGRLDSQLATAQQLVDRLKADKPADALSALQTWNDISIALGAVMSPSSVYSEVHPDKAVRDAAEAAMQQADAFHTSLGLDKDLYEVFAALSADGLDDDAARLLARIMRDFRRAGVDKDDATRERLRALAEEELAASQEFGRNIREGTRTLTFSTERLAGLPADWLQEHEEDEDGMVMVTTDYPDAVPIRTYAHDPQTRHDMVESSLNVAWPENDAVLQRILRLRQEHAELLGYANWADFDAEVKMIGDGAAIKDFIDRIAELSTPAALRDKQILLDRMRQDVPDADDIDAASTAYYTEVVRKEQLEVDAQQVRTYFPFPAVRQGLLDVTGRLFGLVWRPVEDAGTWHEEVASYDVLRDGTRIGRIHLDLHPRDGKFKHAAQFDLVTGVSGRQLPEGVLVCNFNRGLMEHDEVVTLFHEFGHLIHHVIGGDQRWARFSGVATEWDFVEAPSQMLEEWAWDADVLATFAKNAAGETIPVDLVARMRKADDFGKGIQTRTQMFYAALSLLIHLQRPEDLPDDLTEMVQQVQAEYGVLPYIPGTHFQCSFGHLDGYSSGYYTYMWSLVIAKDMFGAFDRDDLFDAAIASAYRDKVLARGGSADAADLVADFLGRPYTFDSFAAWLAE